MPDERGGSSASVAGARVLLVAEAVTLAHVARMVTLARGLRRLGATATVATDPRFGFLFPDAEDRGEPIRSIATQDFAAALARGSPIYDRATLRAYVEDDLSLLRRMAPDVVVGDFRLSLSVSARMLSIPYINVTNAYWSPYARHDWHVPSLPWVPYLGAALSDRVFRMLRARRFDAYARPLNDVRREYRVESQAEDLLGQYCDGDICMYADSAALVPVHGAPPTHRYLGPVAWSPDVALPDWWDALDTRRRTIYVTLGSSGKASRLPQVIDALSQCDCNIVAAAAGAAFAEHKSSNVRIAAYLPGNKVVPHCSLVVCNGGSLSCYQALSCGVPVLALPDNLDQFMNSEYLFRSGAGRWLRPEHARHASLRTAAQEILESATIRGAAIRIAHDLGAQDPARRLADTIAEIAFGERSRHRSPPATSARTS